MDTNSWIYSKNKISFELQSKYFVYVSITSHEIGYLPIKRKTSVRTQYINIGYLPILKNT